MASSFFKSMLNLVYPLHCQICKVKLYPSCELALCGTCWNKIEPNRPPFCTKCGKALPADSQDLAHTCWSCQHTSYSFQRAWSACLYEGLLRECIHLFKYNRKLCLANPLSQLMINFAVAFLNTSGFDFVVPVPLHPTKNREREFNQAHLLAGSLAKKFHIPLSDKNLRRTKFTPPQSDLSREERLRNLRGAFEVRRPAQFHRKKLLLIDDVFTTGATADECARTLMDAGAGEVEVFALARGK